MKRTGKKKASETIKIVVPPIEVRIRIDSSVEGTISSHVLGDELHRAHVVGRGPGSCRHELANELREIADFVAGTTGNPISSAEIFVLTRRIP